MCWFLKICNIINIWLWIKSLAMKLVNYPVYRQCMQRVNVKWSRYRRGVAQRVGRGIALLFHDRGTRGGWVVSSTPRLHFTHRKDPVPILQETGWAPGPVWTGGKSHPHRDSIPDRRARSQSLYRLSYRAHTCNVYIVYIKCIYNVRTVYILQILYRWCIYRIHIMYSVYIVYRLLYRGPF